MRPMNTVPRRPATFRANLISAAYTEAGARGTLVDLATLLVSACG